MLLVTWNEPGSPTISIVYDDESQGLRIATCVDGVPVPGYYGDGSHYVGAAWVGMYEHDYEPTNIAGDILEMSFNRELAPKVMWYRGEERQEWSRRLAEGRPRPGRVIFDPQNPGSVNARNAPQGNARDPWAVQGSLQTIPPSSTPTGLRSTGQQTSTSQSIGTWRAKCGVMGRSLGSTTRMLFETSATDGPTGGIPLHGSRGLPAWTQA